MAAYEVAFSILDQPCLQWMMGGLVFAGVTISSIAQSASLKDALRAGRVVAVEGTVVDVQPESVRNDKVDLPV
jgi:hypothetical protein